VCVCVSYSELEGVVTSCVIELSPINPVVNPNPVLYSRRTRDNMNPVTSTSPTVFSKINSDFAIGNLTQ
jgi:hypothetical protein